MTPAHFLAAALALAVVLSRPVASAPDRYKDESQSSRVPAEATDPGRTQGEPSGDAERQKRAYDTWSGYEGFSRWKPAVYQLSRPYFIPVYGAPGKVPIYFPPQKLNLNPGTPVDNPLPNRPFRGPVYLPPTTEEPVTMKIMDRFNMDDDDDDDRPVWSGSAPANTEKASGIIPTRPPRPPGMDEFPPLVHSVNNGGTNLLAAESSAESVPIIRITTPRSIQSGPSNCVWAIVSCCSASSNVVPDSCFEQRGCPGPFWGSSPCESDFAKAAIASALNYYGD